MPERLGARRPSSPLPFVRDDKKKVKDILADAAITSFARFAIGG